MDMSTTVAPKSNQLNADDLIAGPRTITITHVSGTGNADQPVAVSFEGDDRKPYLPCKSMRRVMINAWGADAAQYVGRSVTLYRDPSVAFGGMEVGGIRISHMSHLEREMIMALTMTKARRAPFKVKPLRMPPPARTTEPQTVDGKVAFLAADGRIHEAPDVEVWRKDWFKRVKALLGAGRLDDLRDAWKRNEEAIAVVATIAPLTANAVVERIREVLDDAAAAARPVGDDDREWDWPGDAPTPTEGAPA